VVALLPSVTLTEQQRVLTLTDVDERLRLANETLAEYMNKMEVEKAIKERVDEDMSSKQKDFYLRQQLKAIQKELGEEESDEDDLAQLTRSLEEANLPAHVEQVHSNSTRPPYTPFVLPSCHPATVTLLAHDPCTREFFRRLTLARLCHRSDLPAHTIRWSCEISGGSRR
jgi:ATP-dependent helicase/DNAse subunit B